MRLEESLTLRVLYLHLLRIGMEMEMDMDGEMKSLYEDGFTLPQGLALAYLLFILF